ncbi:hypothetical protein Cus16_3135 [Curtobacterium sp. ER1/6]|nr:hypothetical protein Cus16_3135 [Curtobacterium sp. ER1/6]
MLAVLRREHAHGDHPARHPHTPGVRRRRPRPVPRRQRGRDRARPAGQRLAAPALVHAHGDLADPVLDERVAGQHELDVRAGGRSRVEHGHVGQVDLGELVLGRDGDDHVRVADVDADPGARTVELLRPDHDVVRAAALDPEVPPAEVGREAVRRALHVDEPLAAADREGLPRCEVDEPGLGEVPGEDADAVAAHLGDRAVGVVVVHEPGRGGLDGDERAPLRDRVGAHRADDPVGADAEAPVGDGADALRGQVDRGVGVGEQDEVVARPLALREVQLGHGTILRAAARSPATSVPLTSSTPASYRLNQETCRRAYFRVATAVAATASSDVARPCRTSSACEYPIAARAVRPCSSPSARRASTSSTSPSRNMRAARSWSDATSSLRSRCRCTTRAARQGRGADGRRGVTTSDRLAISTARTRRRGLRTSTSAAAAGSRARSRARSAFGPCSACSRSSSARSSGSVPGNARSKRTAETYRPLPPTSTAVPPPAVIRSTSARASRWYAATLASSVTSSTSSWWCTMPRRSSSDSFAVPMSMPRYSCIASALTISAGRPASRRCSAIVRATSDLPVPVAPTTAIRSGRSSGVAAAAAASSPDTEARQTERHRPRTRTRRGGGGHAAALGLGPVPRIARAGAADAKRPLVVGDEEVRGRSRDLDGDDVAGTGHIGPLRDGEVHESRVLGAPGHPVRRVVLLALAGRDEDLHGPTDLLRVLLAGDPVLQRDEPVVALLHDLLRQLVGHRRRGGARADGVLEGEGRREPRLLDHAERVREVLLRLTGEADDDVRRDGGVRDPGAHPVEDAEEPLAAVAASHGLEDPVGAGLQRHVQLRHDVRRLRHRVDHVVGEGGRVRAREADALEPLDLAGGAEQLAEGLPVAELDPVRVHVLPEQRHLDGTVVDERLDLGEHVARTAVLLLAPERRHDAERAGVVAPDRDGHPPAVRRVALRRQRRREDVEGLEDLDLRLVVVPRPLEERRQRPHVVRPEHHVHPRRLLEDDVLVLLRQAPADRDLHAGVLALDAGELPEVAVEAVVRVLAHRARVDHDDVRLAAVRCHVPRRLERPAQTLGVVHVHLAPVGADLVGAGAGCDGGHDRPV